MRKHRFYVIVGLAVIVITTLPYVYGWLNQTPEQKFIGFTEYGLDGGNFYLAWMKQAKDGHFLFEDKYTSEPQPRNIFLIFFLIGGLISRVFHLPLTLVWHLLRVMATIIFLICVYYLIRYFIKEELPQKIAFSLVCFSSGFGWYAILSKMPIFYKITTRGRIPINLPADLMTTKITTFRCMYIFGHTTFSFALMIMIFLLMKRAYDEGKNSFTIGGGILSIFVAFIHSYDLVIIYLVLGISLVVELISAFSREKTKKFIIFICVSLPGVFGIWYTAYTNPVVREWTNSLLRPIVPHPLSLCLGLGFNFLFGLVGAVWILRKKDKRLYFPIYWVVACLALAYFPLRPIWTFLESMHIPVCILSAIGLFWVSRVLLQRGWFSSKGAYAALVIFVLLTIPTNVHFLLADVRHIRDRIFPLYIPGEIYQSLGWLDKNIESEDVVLSSSLFSNFIPAYTGSKVFVGNWAETIDYDKKCKWVEKFMSKEAATEFRLNLLKEYNITHILVSPRYQDFNKLEFTKKYLKKTYQNKLVTIYKVSEKIQG